jgi:hypothetical protein
MPPEGLRRELCIRSHVAACMAAPVFDPQKALNYQRALATSTRIVDEPASVPGLLQNHRRPASRGNPSR